MIRSFKKYMMLLIMCVFCIGSSVFISGCETTSANGVNSPYKYIGGTDDYDADEDNAEIDRTAVKNLEQRVQILEDDFASMKPSIQNLIAIESDIQELISELAKLTNSPEQQLDATQSPAPLNSAQYPFNTDDNNADGTVSTPADLIAQIENNTNNVPKDIATQISQTTPKLSPASPTHTIAPNTITDIRFGQHQNKIRVVIDYSKGTTPDYDIYKEGEAVILEVIKANWATKNSQAFSKLPLIKSYKTTKDGNTTKVAFETRGDDMTVKIFTLPPLTSSKGPRLVIDFERGVS